MFTWRILLWIGLGVVAGAALGYYGKCRSGSCPFTATPWRGALLGALFGAVGWWAFSRPVLAEGNAAMTPAEFEKKILEADEPVLVDFFATWCGPCKALAPRLDKLEEQYEGKAKFVRIDVDKAPKLAKKYGVRSIPTVIVFQGGEAKRRIVGLNPSETYANALDSALESASLDAALDIRPHGNDTNRAETSPTMKGEPMTQGTGVTFKGTPLTLVGETVEVGDEAPGFTALTTGLEEKSLDDLQGKTLVLVTVPSLDTSVCSTETKRFNDEATKLGDDVQIVVLSMDLPFAQKRWCGAEGVDNVETLSDHRDADFGTSYGVLIKELRLLARAVFVVDSDGKIRYKQLVSEVTNEPDYDAVLEAVRKTSS